ncbi:recQ-mediated genome instability protein 1-like [Argopecten irradians]|uniref:recQ-mediated genome instability protein 1-like n=1 Tax=Argopecten irradians TaxID=31199 RepID=UPI0037227BE0
MTGAIIGQTRAWLRSRSVLVPDDWLEACVEWIKEENQGNSIIQSRINELVFEQWLLADLHELGTHCLPNGLTEATKYQLSGSYALQIDSMVDVGKSFYSQLQKIQGTENANAAVSAEASDQKPWEPKPSQMMMLNLTDGTNNIKGMEYKPMSCLGPKLQPGTKVIVSGSVMCRRGVLFLTNNNLRVMGGEVDTLIEENTKVKVLQEALDSSMQNTGNTHRQEYRDTDIKPSQMSGRNTAIPRNNQGGSVNRHQPGSGNARSGPGNKAPVNDSVLDDWDMEDLAMDDDMMDELDNIEMSQPGNQNGSYNMANNVTVTNGQSSTTANYKNNNMSSLPKNRNLSVHSGSYTTAGTKEEQVSQPRYNENMTLRNVISESRSGRRNSSDEMPNSKRQKLSSSASAGVQENSASNYDSVFNDEFEDDFDDDFVAVTPSKLGGNKTAKNTNVIPKSTVKAESNQYRSSFGENSGEIVQNLLSPLEINSGNRNKSSVDKGAGTSGKKPLFTNSSGSTLASYNNSAINTVVKVEPASPVSRVGGGQASIDNFVRTPPTGQRNSKSPTGQNGNSTKNGDGQKKLTDFTLVKPCNGIDAEPFTYLSIAKKQLTPLDSVTFKVKAYISTLIGRLDSSGGKEWKLACKINDGSDTLDVDLSSGVLTSLIGFSAPDSMVMKKRAKHDPSIKDVLIEGIQQCQQKLIELLCIMEIRVMPSKPRPEVIALHEMTPGRIDALRTRVTHSLDNK